MDQILKTDLSKGFRLDDYNYDLPEHLIAQYPLKERDHSRMLVVHRDTGEIQHRYFYELPEFISAQDILVLNNTKVLPVRLIGNRQGFSGKVELFLLEPLDQNSCQWRVLMKPSRKLKPGTIVEFPNIQSTASVLSVGESGKGEVEFQLVEFSTVLDLLNHVGQMPIPPYLAREAEASDRESYQTIFSKIPGAQAAPTAGLHFTEEILSHIKAQGAGISEVTLSVSAGTFRPVVVDDITQHEMDPEYYTICPEASEQIIQTQKAGGKVFAVGTTVAKTLESSAVKHGGEPLPDSDWSRLFIYPGFQFQVVDALLTNFHLPKSTLMMLVSAFANRELILNAYKKAVQEGYRFYSYGDCMLIL